MSFFRPLYIVPMIQGEVRRYIRDTGPIRISRSLRDIAYKAMQAKEHYIAEHKNEPTIAELARIIDVKERDVVTALESISEPISLYEPVFSDSGDTLYVLDQLGDKSDDSSWIDEISLKEAITSLDKREKKILYLRFALGKTQVEVANEIGISQAQVSRIEKFSLDRIKGKL